MQNFNYVLINVLSFDFINLGNCSKMCSKSYFSFNSLNVFFRSNYNTKLYFSGNISKRYHQSGDVICIHSCIIYLYINPISS